MNGQAWIFDTAFMDPWRVRSFSKALELLSVAKSLRLASLVGYSAVASATEKGQQWVQVRGSGAAYYYCGGSDEHLQHLQLIMHLHSWSNCLVGSNTAHRAGNQDVILIGLRGFILSLHSVLSGWRPSLVGWRPSLVR